MSIVIFDLDKTFIAGYNDFLWGEFIHKAGIVETDYQEKQIIFMNADSTRKCNSPSGEERQACVKLSAFQSSKQERQR